jgi:hypothetical protein
MTWNEAYNLITANIHEGLELEPERENTRQVESVNHICTNHDYNGEEGLEVRIGNAPNSKIEIPFSMLQNVFEESLRRDRIFNKDTFRVYHPTRAEQETGHPCHIHVIGRIFEKAGIADQINARNFRIRELENAQ